MKDALCDVPHRSVHAMLDELIELATSDEWRMLNEVRGEVFHRSRPESSISSGLDGESGYASAITDHAGKPIGIAVGGWNRYSGGDTRSDQESAATRAARPLRRAPGSAATVSLPPLPEPRPGEGAPARARRPRTGSPPGRPRC